MSNYSRLRLLDRIAAPTLKLFSDLGEADGSRCFPSIIRFRHEDEAFEVLLSKYEGGEGYGHTLTYYKRSGGRWYRWMLERPDLPRDERWETVDEPFEGIAPAVAYERRLGMLSGSMTPDDLEAALSSAPLNRDFVLPYGKYSGRSLAELAQSDPGYIGWAFGNMRNIAPSFLK